MYHVNHQSLACCQTTIYLSALTTKYNWGWWEFALFLQITGHELLRHFNLNRTSPPASVAKAKVIKMYSLEAMNICRKFPVNSSSYFFSLNTNVWPAGQNVSVWTIVVKWLTRQHRSNTFRCDICWTKLAAIAGVW